MSRIVKLGLIQVEQRDSDGYEERLDILYKAAEDCFREGAELVFFPEAYQHAPDRSILFRPEEQRVKAAAWKDRCAALAKKYHAYLAPWDYETTEDGRIYNSTYILDRNGEEVGRFRKVHLTYTEQMWGLTNGDDFPVFDLDFGKVGVMICWDNYFPESARCLGNRGAELVLYPLYGDTLIPQWELKLRTRAADSGMYIASCQIGHRLDVAWSGLVSPDGTVLHRLSRLGSHLVVEAELGQPVITHTTGIPECQEDLRIYTDRCRRPGAYAALTETNPPRSWEEIFQGNPPVLRK